MRDVLENLKERKIDCLNKGFVQIVDMMPRLVPDGQTADYAVVQMARTSYGHGTKTVNEDRGLIRYLMRHSHTSPFEGVEFKFHMRMPIFVARQMVRHRTASLNEISARYSVLVDEFYYPTQQEVRLQSAANKQCSDGFINEDDGLEFVADLRSMSESSYRAYEKSLAKGISRELARAILPINIYTEWYWKCDLHNLLRFLALRADAHAQWEIRVYANAMLDLIRPLVPWSVEAWEDYDQYRGGLKLTRLEVERLRKVLSGLSVASGDIETSNKREQSEWKLKAVKLGLAA